MFKFRLKNFLYVLPLTALSFSYQALAELQLQDAELAMALEQGKIIEVSDGDNVGPFSYEDKNAPTAVNTIASETVVSQVTQPTVHQSQRQLLGTKQEYLMVVKPTSRIYVNDVDGQVYFFAKKGSLKDNLTALFESTSVSFPLIYHVSEQHHNPTDMWLYGENVLDILNSLLASYNEPHPIRATSWGNRIVEIYYDKKNRRS